jgi:hypothetical protein
MVCPKFSCIQTEKVGYRGAHLLPFFQLGGPKRCFYGVGQSIIWLLRNKEKVVDTHMN